jgi:hypothetical protein
LPKVHRQNLYKKSPDLLLRLFANWKTQSYKITCGNLSKNGRLPKQKALFPHPVAKVIQFCVVVKNVIKADMKNLLAKAPFPHPIAKVIQFCIVVKKRNLGSWGNPLN